MAIVTTHSAKSKLGGIHYTTGHTGKMSGIESVSTSPLLNKFCQSRRKHDESICAHCFAHRLLEQRKSMRPGLEDNARILSTRVLTDSEIPVIPTRLFRFEAFGDLINDIQVENYFNIARKNPDTLCAMWTKKPIIVKKAIERGCTKPDNLQIVYSSVDVNKVSTYRAPFIDKVFTVYDSQTIKTKGVDINCGAKSCLTCQRCYRPNPDGVTTMYINEKLK